MGFLDSLFQQVGNAFSGMGGGSKGGGYAANAQNTANSMASRSAGGSLGNAKSYGIGKGSSMGSAMSSFVPSMASSAYKNGSSSSFKPQQKQNTFNPQVNSGGMSGGGNSQFNPIKPVSQPINSFSPTPPPTGSGMSTDVADVPEGSSASKGQNIMEMIFGGGDMSKILGGLATMGVGNMMGKSPGHQDFNTQEMQNYQNYNTGKLPQGVEDMINRTAGINEEQQTRNLRDVYKNARPGTDYTTDSAYQRDLANLQRTQTMNRADAQANALKGFSQQELSRAQDLAQKSVEEIMFNTGMDAAEATSIKEMFGNVGGAMISSGLGLDQFQLPGKKAAVA